MTTLAEEARMHRRKKATEARDAAMRAAFFLTTGMEIAAALALQGAARTALTMRLERLIERERLRGAARHWSYDLNRHIALKQALDRVEMAGSAADAAPLPADGSVGDERTVSGKRTGVRRRRKDGGASRRRRPIGSQASDRISAQSCACDPGPSSWRAANGRPRSSAQPSDRSRRGPTSRGTGPASGRNGSSGGA